MSVLADLTRADRQRLLERLAEAEELDRMMRKRGTLAGPDQPLPLHRSCGMNKVSTTNMNSLSATERTRP